MPNSRLPPFDESPPRPEAPRSVYRAHGYIGQSGRVVRPLPAFAADAEALIALYRWMLLCRHFDTRAVALQRTGQLGTYAAATGQEAVPVGVAHAMIDADVLIPTYREAIAQVMRGARFDDILRYWGGDERGADYAATPARHDFPPAVPIASQVPHAAGVAFALKHGHRNGAAVCFIGDGGTSKGDFYEGINLAGAWQLPLVVVIVNNQWAISVPRRAQTAAETLAHKALAAGIQGVQVDGNDVVAVREVLDHALRAARTSHAPCVIEALTYRLCDHTTADDASRYRSAAELEEARKHDPVARLRTHLQHQGLLDASTERALEADCEATITHAVDAYLATPSRSTASIFEHLYAELPAELVRQQARLAETDHGP